MMPLVGWLMYNGLRSLPLARGSFQICILSKCMFGGVCDEIEKVQIVHSDSSPLKLGPHRLRIFWWSTQ